MPYIECPNCSADVSVTEENCPECGERIRSTPEDFIIKGKTLCEYTGDNPVAMIPDGVLYIGKDAFNCWIDEIDEPEGFCVEYVVIPEGVRKIGVRAFWNTNLSGIRIPSSVVSIGKQVFSSSVEIEVAEDNPVYHVCNGCLIETASKTLIRGTDHSVIPADGSVTRIGDYAFAGCYGLTGIDIPESVTSIGKCAFSGTGLTGIGIPESVTSIGDFAFAGCQGLKTMAIPDTVTSIGDLAFSYCPELTDMYYSGTLEQWRKVKTDDSIYTTNEPYRKMTVHCADGSLEVCFSR